MPHNPNETHCSKCDVQLIHTSAMGEFWSYCPNCDVSDDLPEDCPPLPQDNYNYDPHGDSWR